MFVGLRVHHLRKPLVCGDLRRNGARANLTHTGPLLSRLTVPLVSLRGCKADVVVGVTDEEAQRAQSEDPRWRISGRYALVSFAAGKTSA